MCIYVLAVTPVVMDKIERRKQYNADYHRAHKEDITARKKIYDAIHKERRNELARIRRRKPIGIIEVPQAVQN